MIDQIRAHDNAVVGDGGSHDGVLHHRGLGASRARVLADWLAGARPCGLPLRHLGRVRHERRRDVEVLAQRRAVAEGLGVVDEGACSNVDG